MLEKQSIIRKSILLVIIIASFFGLRFWSGYEEVRGRDIIVAATLSEASDALERFYNERSAYPVQLPSLLNSAAALKYSPLSDDAKSPCTSKNVCPHYSLEFTLATNALLPKGKHVYTDEGLR